MTHEPAAAPAPGAGSESCLPAGMVPPVLSPIHGAGGEDGTKAVSEGRAVLLALSHTVSVPTGHETPG